MAQEASQQTPAPSPEASTQRLAEKYKHVYASDKEIEWEQATRAVIEASQFEDLKYLMENRRYPAREKDGHEPTTDSWLQLVITEAGGHTDLKIFNYLLDKLPTEQRADILQASAAKGNIAAVKRLLALGVPPDARGDTEETTPLLLAIKAGKI
jgi:hypothetical protein